MQRPPSFFYNTTHIKTLTTLRERAPKMAAAIVQLAGVEAWIAAHSLRPMVPLCNI
jgi:hypothetical protein